MGLLGCDVYVTLDGGGEKHLLANVPARDIPLRSTLVFAFCSDIIGGMSYIPPIPKAHLETYRAAARAYRAARRLGARQHEWHWAAVREVIKRHPEMTHREADSFAQSIIRYVSLYYGTWFWN